MPELSASSATLALILTVSPLAAFMIGLGFCTVYQQYRQARLLETTMVLPVPIAELTPTALGRPTETPAPELVVSSACPDTEVEESARSAVQAAACLPPRIVGRTCLERVCDTVVLEALRRFLITNPEWLGTGRDVRLTGVYGQLQLACAWRLGSSLGERFYEVGREVLESRLAVEGRSEFPPVDFRFADAAPALGIGLDKRLNEALLLHGTRPETLHPILTTGLNQRLSLGLFGNGTYLAEDAGKCDQYCIVDETLLFGPMHNAMYPVGEEHPGRVLYMILCSVLLGHVALSQDGKTTLSGGDVWANEGRSELAQVPGSDPPTPHDSLIVEPGARLARYREVVVFHRERVLPRYLIAYWRRQ